MKLCTLSFVFLCEEETVKKGEGDRESKREREIVGESRRKRGGGGVVKNWLE